MIPESGLPVRKVLDVKQKLILRLVQILLVPQNPAHIGQKQDGHEQGVVPQLLLVHRVRGDVLQSALPGAGKISADPLGPLPAHLHVILPALLLRHIGHGKQRGHGVHVLGRKTDLHLPLIVGEKDIHVPLIPCLPVQLPDSKQPHPLGPFPKLVLSDIIVSEAFRLHPFQEPGVFFIKDFLEPVQIPADSPADILPCVAHVLYLLSINLSYHRKRQISTLILSFRHNNIAIFVFYSISCW